MSSSCPAVAPGTVGVRPELSEFFRRFGPTYLANHVVSPEQGRVLRHILACRTPAMGGHAHACDRCGHAWHAYNSCRDRHCPLCQGRQQRRWIESRQKRLVPTHHFHVVFTLPEALRPLCLSNRSLLYDRLFRAARDTLLELAADRWDALPGVTAVLHTWTRQLLYHPHLHCIVTGGGLSEDDGWVACRKNFLFPVKVMGALFRGKFLARLRALFDAGELRFVGTSAQLEHPVAFEALLAGLRRQSWVVYAKKPFGSTHHLVRYLGLYTHRVAISSSRIRSIADDAIVFETRSDQPDCALAPDEFIRRFLLHTLPARFRKIRHYGLYAPSNVAGRLAVAQELAGGMNRAQRREDDPEVALRPARDNQCPECGYWPIRTRRLPPVRGPP